MSVTIRYPSLSTLPVPVRRPLDIIFSCLKDRVVQIHTSIENCNLDGQRLVFGGLIGNKTAVNSVVVGPPIYVPLDSGEKFVNEIDEAHNGNGM